MKRILRSLVVLSLLLSGYAYATTYTFTGTNYESVSGSYTTAMRVTGSITTSSPIPPNSVNIDISGILTSWSFFDGVQTISSVNGVTSPHQPPTAATNASGTIIGVVIHAYSKPVATVVGQPQNYILLIAFQNISRHGSVCANVRPNGFCGAAQFGDAGVTNTAGVWQTVASTPIPTMSQWSLILLTLLLGMVGFARLRFSSQP
jgi:hypothetical protein